jgi:arsenate reductase
MNSITIYGIPNCDTTKKAIGVLNKQQVKYVFHDYKRSGITEMKLKAWSKKEGWEKILNKRSTTWRELPEATQLKIKDEAAAIQLMLQNNSIIKRPIVEHTTGLIIGFDEKAISGLR